MIFIDCGAYKGKALNWARLKFDNPKLYAFECNPHLSKVDYGSDVTVIRKAIWITDGNLRFYMNTRHPLIEGHSVYKDKTTGNIDKEHPVVVQCIDFSKFLFSLEKDEIVIKMNVEGAEYDVLEHCVNTGAINLINQLHIQWHYHKIPRMEDRHIKLQKNLKEIKTLKIFNGYGKLKS